MKKLLVICGPTAVGKTAMSISLAKKFSLEVISADSRQVYKGMDIGTGKDLPAGIKIWGYDLADPKEDFSVAQYVSNVNQIIEKVYKQGKLPILVGGTGLYIDSVVKGIDTISIPRNEALRNSLANKNANELFEILKVADPIKAESLNISDKKNPRRLIRAIEIGESKYKFKKKQKKYNSLFIGLIAPRNILFKRVEQRVDQRIQMGFENEMQKLVTLGLNSFYQSQQALGYKQWWQYKNNQKTRQWFIDEWKNMEKKYVVRQLTWFKRYKNIRWFDIINPNLIKEVENFIYRWYYQVNSD